MLNEIIRYKSPSSPAFLSAPSRNKKGPLCDMHFHEELEFLIINQGSIKLFTETDEIILTAGDIAFVNSNVPHMTECIENITSSSLAQFKRPSHIKSSLKYLSEFFMQSMTQIYIFKKDDKDYKELSEVLTKLIEESKNEDIACDYYITSGIYQIIALLYRKNLLSSENRFINTDAIEKLVPVFEYINKNYNLEISLDVLAKEVNLNKEYLCRLFKKATKKTISDYINLVRISKASEFLKKNISISEVAMMSGFSSLSYFNKVFKDYKHCSPGTYKKIYSKADMLIE